MKKLFWKIREMGIIFVICIIGIAIYPICMIWSKLFPSKIKIPEKLVIELSLPPEEAQE